MNETSSENFNPDRFRPLVLTATFFIFRHGETFANQSRVIDPDPNSQIHQLSQNGLFQAENMGSWLENQLPANLYIGDIVVSCSDLNRSVQTAQIILKKADLPLPIKQSPLLREINFGSNAIGELKTSETGKAQMRDPTLPYPSGESYNDLYDRLIDFLNSLDESKKVFVIVGHSRTNWVLRAILQGVQKSELKGYLLDSKNIRPKNNIVTLIRFENGVCSISYFNTETGAQV